MGLKTLSDLIKYSRDGVILFEFLSELNELDSYSRTSNPAPNILFDFNPLTRSSVTTTFPLEVFINQNGFFIFSMNNLSKNPIVFSVCGRCKLNIWALLIISSRLT